MKFNFKKIASVLATTVMLGSTVAFATAAWPTPFVNNGVGDAAIVVGAGAATTDTVAATDLGASLDNSITAAASATLSGTGDQAGIDTSSRRIYYGDALNSAKLTLSSSEMPTVLADGKVVSLTGTEYSYTQTIKLGGSAITFGTSGGDLNDPTLYIDAGTSADVPVYNYTLSLNKNLDVSDATNVQGQKIKILGVDYVIGASSNTTAAVPILYLYGAGETVKIAGSESKTVTISGKEHTVELVAATATNTAKITVDGVSKTVAKGSSYSYAGDLNVYVKDITYQSYAGGVQDAELIIGANTLVLQNGASVKVGADQTSIPGTKAGIQTSGGLLSSLNVQVAAKKSQTDSIGIGSSMTDPVFGGLKVQLVSTTPALTDSSRAKIVVSTDNNQYAYVTFTSARAGEKGEQRLTYAYDASTSSSIVQPILAHTSNQSSNKGVIHVLEGEDAKINDWIVVNQGDAGIILNVDDITFDTATSGTVTFSDVITGESQKITLTAATAAAEQFQKTGVNFYGGNGYTITTSNDTTTPNTVNITWNAAGTQTLFPRIKLKTGGWIALLTQTTFVNGTSIILPDGLTTLATTGETVYGSNRTSLVNHEGMTWGLRNATDDVNVVVQSVSLTGTNAGGTCIFNSSRGPAILYMEPKKTDDTSYGSAMCIPMNPTGSSPEITINTPIVNGSVSTFQTLGSDTYKTAAIDQYGSHITFESRTNENGVATILAPASQMYFDVKFTSEAVSAGTKETVKVVTDAETASVSSKNLIVVGGSCINKAAAMVLTGKEDAVCGDAFAALTTAGPTKYLIQVAASPYNDAKIAMLVAGYDAPETTTAVAKLKDGTVATDLNTKVIGPVTA